MTEIDRSQASVEVLVPLDRAGAERLDKRVRLMAGTLRGNFETVGRLLDEAKAGRIHEVLGFASWPAYVADSLGGQLQLSAESRQAMVALMHIEGMSERAIAQATGASKSTVHRDIDQVVHDGPPHHLDRGDTDDGESTDGQAERPSSPPAPSAAPTTTTLNGKSFRRQPKPSPTPDTSRPKPRRGPLVDDASRLGLELDKVAKKIRRLLNDDRFAANRQQIGGHIRMYVEQADQATAELHLAITPTERRPPTSAE